MEIIAYIFVVFMGLGGLVLCLESNKSSKDAKVNNVLLDSVGITLGKFYKFKDIDGSNHIFVPIEVDSMGLRYFISFDGLNGGDTLHTTNLEKFKDNITEITYSDIFKNEKTNNQI